MEQPGTFVVFKHENEDFILQNEQIMLKRYYQEFNGEREVQFKTKFSHKYVKMFFEFLQLGTVPEHFEDQIQVFQLLKEWDCHIIAFDSLRFRIVSQKKNFLISHLNQLYPVNNGCLYFHSSRYQEFCLSNPHEIFHIDHECAPKAIEIFLDLLHCRIIQPELGYVDEVLELSRYLGCSSLIALINWRSPESILSLILRKQHEESFDFSFCEQVIIEDLESYLLLSDFGHVCLPLLCRIFQKSKSVFSISLLRPFFESCVAFHGSKASVLLSLIRFQPADSIDELNKFISVFSINHSDDFFSLNSHLLHEFTMQFEEFKQDNQEMRVYINILKQEKIEDKKIIEELHQQMDRKEAEDQKRIEELMKRLTELEEYQQEMVWRKKEKEERRLQEEQEKKRREEEQRKREEQEQKEKEEEERKQKEEFERNEKWKSTKAPDFEGNIFEAAAKGKLTSIIYLLANGTNVNEKYQNDEYDGWGRMKNSTPIHFSFRYGHLNVVEYLVNQNADIDSKNDGLCAPLHFAAGGGCLSVVEYLVNQKADINAKDKNDSTPLHYAAFNGHLSVVEYLVNHKAEMNPKAGKIGTPLHVAAEKGHHSVVEYLLHQGADFRDGINGSGYLHYASGYGLLSVVEYLVNQKADINEKGSCYEFFYLIGLLFILLLKKVILVLLNI